jgi:hypothetical protein
MSEACLHAAWDQTMSNPQLRTPFGHVELRPVASPPGVEDMRTYVLLPDLDELLGAPGFGLRDPIVVGNKRKGLFALASLSFH